jgi:phenylacetate-CoA ligase
MSWFGIMDMNAKIATFRGDFVESFGDTKRLWHYNSLIKELCFNGYAISEENIKKMMNKLNAFQPEIIRGFPHILYIISRFILEKRLALDFTPKLIYVSSENLYEYMTNSIATAFNTPIMDRYGQAEYVLSISNCNENTYHQNMELSILESLKSKSKNNGSMRMIGTCLFNYSMPFLRYDLEDLIEEHEESFKCNCGRDLLPISRLNGRVNDFIRTSDGRYISGGAFDHYLKHRILNKLNEIPEYIHVIQDDYTHFTIELYFSSRSTCHSDEMRVINNGLLELFGNKNQLDIINLEYYR